jgi:DNA gyrase subunit A
MDDQIFAKETLSISLEEEMRRSYLDYAMSVIVGRALPDVRDGLKPVHRRVLFAMYELSNDWNRAYKKSARIVGDVIGKYHPHGDVAVYDTVVRMAQDFSLRYPLIDGQGNFGSIDGDNAAAMRYTEIRMARITHELLADLGKETVDFAPNYDNAENEPLVLPSRLPNLLVNGSSGIAVGMATNIPPHNLNEVIDACRALLTNPELDIEELIGLIPAPDFPTAGIIYGTAGVHEGYRTGRGRVIMRAKTHVEAYGKGEREAIIVDEIPYQVNKARLLARIGELVQEKQIEGISDLRDESDKSGMRIVIELKRGEMPEIVLNQLYKLTQLQDNFGINMVALVNGQPKLLNLKQMLEEFLRHRREVVTRRTVFELKKARDRCHILEGLSVSLSNVDEIIKLIKASPNPSVAKTALLSRTWHAELVEALLSKIDQTMNRPENIDESFGLKHNGYLLSEVQAQAILDMRLQKLTGLEQDKIMDEYRQTMNQIIDLSDILAKPERILRIIDEELSTVKSQFGDSRRSQIEPFAGEVELEDLITPQDMVVTLSHGGYIKSQPIDDYRTQHRGGRGKQAASTKEDDFIDTLFVANTHDYLLCFSSFGRCYWIKVYNTPQGRGSSRGKPIINLLALQPEEKINAVLPISTFEENRHIFMCTAHGVVKKTPLLDFSRPRTNGIIALNLDDDDVLIGATLTSGQDEIMLFSSHGKAIRFDESDVRSVGRSARGVRGMDLAKDKASVIAMLVSRNQTQQVLAATANGYGKRTPIMNYRKCRRGAQGVIAIDTGPRNGILIAVSLVKKEDDLILITDGGVLIRMPAKQVRETGRTAQGVKLINLDEGEKLIGMGTVVDKEEIDSGKAENYALF